MAKLLSSSVLYVVVVATVAVTAKQKTGRTIKDIVNLFQLCEDITGVINIETKFLKLWCEQNDIPSENA